MPIVEFPPIETADENGLLAVGGDFSFPTLLMAYYQGIFPWPLGREYPLTWFCPDPRGVLFADNFRVNRRLKRDFKKAGFRHTFNQDFRSVIEGCRDIDNRSDQGDTWITNELIEGYVNFHNEGYAYSIEIWNQEGELVGGLFGVKLGAYVTGESMFYRQSHASKYALAVLMEKLEQKGIQWLDTQMVSPVVGQMGGIEIDREDFLNLHKEACRATTFSF